MPPSCPQVREQEAVAEITEEEYRKWDTLVLLADRSEMGAKKINKAEVLRTFGRVSAQEVDTSAESVVQLISAAGNELSSLEDSIANVTLPSSNDTEMDLPSAVIQPFFKELKDRVVQQLREMIGVNNSAVDDLLVLKTCALSRPSELPPPSTRPPTPPATAIANVTLNLVPTAARRLGSEILVTLESTRGHEQSESG